MSAGHRVLLIGSGSREHAIALKLAESKKVKEVFVAPGNGGTESTGNSKIYNLKLDVNKNEDVLNWCKEQNPSLVVIGPEDPLDRGLANILIAHNFEVFGPTKLAAQIECDKGFAKDFMQRNKIPTAEYKLFSDAKEALAFLDNPTFTNPLVIKATGLALGKGVVVAKSIAEAKQAVSEMLINKKFGASGETIVIEQFLEGDEFSVLAFCDGKSSNVRLMPTAQDHKRAYFKDQGPNTGGMGCISPFVLLNDQKLEEVKKNIMQATVESMAKEDRMFVGVLFAGLMLTTDGEVKVLEFNCRFGDPETQTILPLLQSDLFDIMLSCTKNYSTTADSLSSTVASLNEIPVEFAKKNCVSYVIASGGYPETSTKHLEIRGLDAVKRANRDNLSVEIYHAATYLKNSKYYTNGGRCLSLVFKSDMPFLELLKISEIIVNNTIDIDSFFYRPDIGQKTIKKFLKL